MKSRFENWQSSQTNTEVVVRALLPSAVSPSNAISPKTWMAVRRKRVVRVTIRKLNVSIDAHSYVRIFSQRSWAGVSVFSENPLERIFA